MTSALESSANRLATRPGRAALVIADLTQLHGPHTGVVELPHRMLWLPPQHRRFDLTDDYDSLRMYEIVLREAVQHHELRTLLNTRLLVRMWPHLLLPRGVRTAWQQRHPDLAAA